MPPLPPGATAHDLFEHRRLGALAYVTKGYLTYVALPAPSFDLYATFGSHLTIVEVADHLALLQKQLERSESALFAEPFLY